MSDAIEQLRTRAEGRTAVGIMTGTSMDAIDAAVVRISAGRAEVLASLEHRAWICGVKFTPADDNRSQHCVNKKKKKTNQNQISAFPPGLRRLLLALVEPGRFGVTSVTRAHFAMAEACAEAVNAVVARAREAWVWWRLFFFFFFFFAQSTQPLAFFDPTLDMRILARLM
jgi:hypothetical protein